MRVKPGSSRTSVGGSYPGPRGEALLIAVTAPAADGRANDAVVDALAVSLAVRKREITLVSGYRGRDKIVQVTAPDGQEHERLTARLSALLEA